MNHTEIVVLIHQINVEIIENFCYNKDKCKYGDNNIYKVLFIGENKDQAAKKVTTKRMTLTLDSTKRDNKGE